VRPAENMSANKDDNAGNMYTVPIDLYVINRMITHLCTDTKYIRQLAIFATHQKGTFFVRQLYYAPVLLISLPIYIYNLK
jgi:hypothetical protein